jgi:DNA-binding PadR family transcriptional regulator
MDAAGRPFRPEQPDDDALDQRGPQGGRRHGHGPGFGPGFGPGGPGFGPGRRGRRGWGGPRPRGDVRAAILLLLAEQPRHGYELIGEITDRSGGVWAPSPGSIYPTLQSLEDEGLIRLEKVEGRRTASLTDTGTAWVAEHREELGDPFEVGGPPAAAIALHEEFRALVDAMRQVARVGSAAQLARATAAVTTARKELYRLLADDDPTDT